MEQKKIINKIECAFCDYGGTNIPLIFIHGFPFNKDMWNDQVSALKDKYRVITYDVRGHGNSSSGNETFSVRLFAEDLIALMDYLEIGKAVVCGLSMGGYILLTALENQLHRFAGIILADTQCIADSLEVKAARKKAIESVRTNGIETYAEENVKKLLTPQSISARSSRARRVKSWIIANGEETICSTLEALAGREETCDVLHRVKVPSLIIVGAEDKLTPPSAAMMLHHGIKDAQLEIIEEAAHLSNLEQPDIFNNLLLTFMKHFDHE